jgi:threonine synthase
VESGSAVSIFGEGGSPLIHAQKLGKQLNHPHIYIKDERQSTTGSFKDRQAAISVAVMRSQGVKECVLASAGNAAAAYAAYCAQADIKLWVFVSSKVVPEKMREVALYGAEVVKVSGTYDQTKKIAADFARRRGFYLERGAKSLASIAAMKTIAYELAEQMNWQAPDWYVQAVSGGLGPLGVYQGFADLFALGLVDRIPKLAVVQVEGCSPMVRAFQAGMSSAEAIVPHTLIDVLSTGDPGYAYTQLYRIIQQRGGTMLTVTDEEAFVAMRQIARLEGLSMEPAAAVAFAGLEELMNMQLVTINESVVINCSGHTFPVEKQILGDQWSISLDLGQTAGATHLPEDGLAAALEQLDEKVTTIVVIDDEPNDIRLIRRFLERYKAYRVYSASNGRDGIELIRERVPDLIILDLMMPGTDGFTLLETIKADSGIAHIPVIVVSAKELTLREARFLNGNTQAVWSKGHLRPKEFVENVVDVLTQNDN